MAAVTGAVGRRKGMKFTNTGKWCTSVDEELFYDEFNTKEEAIDFVREEYGEGYIGESVAVEFMSDDFNWDADYALGELLYEEVGEAADSWHLSQEDEAELSRRLGEVMVEFLNKRNLQPECFKVINVEQVTRKEGGE